MLTLDLINDQIQNFVSSLVGPYPSLKVRANFIETEGIEVAVYRQERMFSSEKDLRYVLWVDAESIRILKWDLGESLWKQNTEFTSLIDFCTIFTQLLFRIYSTEQDVEFPDFLTALFGDPIETWKDYLVSVFTNCGLTPIAFADSVAFDGNVIRFDGKDLTLEGIVNYSLTLEDPNDIFMGLSVLLTVYDVRHYQDTAEERDITALSSYFGQLGFFPINEELKEAIGITPFEEKPEGSVGGGGGFSGGSDFGAEPMDTFDDTISGMGEEPPMEDMGGGEEAPPTPEEGGGDASINDLAADLLQEDTGTEE